MLASETAALLVLNKSLNIKRFKWEIHARMGSIRDFRQFHKLFYALVSFFHYREHAPFVVEPQMFMRNSLQRKVCAYTLCRQKQRLKVHLLHVTSKIAAPELVCSFQMHPLLWKGEGVLHTCFSSSFLFQNLHRNCSEAEGRERERSGEELWAIW